MRNAGTDHLQCHSISSSLWQSISRSGSLTSARGIEMNAFYLQHVDEIKETSGDIKLEGFISLDGAHSKVEQFTLVNYRCSWDVCSSSHINSYVGRKRRVRASNANCTAVCFYPPDINRHPVATCDIHRIIDSKFASSSFTKHVRISSSLILVTTNLLAFYAGI